MKWHCRNPELQLLVRPTTHFSYFIFSYFLTHNADLQIHAAKNHALFLSFFLSFFDVWSVGFGFLLVGYVVG